MIPGPKRPEAPTEEAVQDPSVARPPYLYPDYRATRLRAPRRPLVVLPERLLDPGGPVFGELTPHQLEADLTRQHKGEPLGQRIIVAGTLRDGSGRPIRGQLIEIWQANAAGRYAHQGDQHPAPLDPNFTGTGRLLTDSEGRYRFVTIRPGAYPWQNNPNAWRPAHIHFSVFGTAFDQRLVTQMYFPGDPLMATDPISSAIEPRARRRMVSDLDLGLTVEQWALGYRFDIVVEGSAATPFEEVGRA